MEVGSATNKKQIIRTQFETPLRTMTACAVDDGICLLEFSDRRMLPTEYKMLERGLNATVEPGTSPHFDLLQRELRDYFDGSLQTFTVPLMPVGTAFQQAVWKELLTIPYGTTRSYKQQALALNNLPAIRAVAQANGMNKIAIVIPCHRVIGDNGNLTGYGGGLWRKKRLLELERSRLEHNVGTAVQKKLFDVQ